MILKTFNISLSIDHFQKSLIDTGITMVEDDILVYKLLVAIYDQRTQIDLSTAISSAKFVFNKSDGNYAVSTATIEATGSLSLVVSTGIIDFAGILLGECRLYNASGARITTNQFKMNVIDDLDD